MERINRVLFITDKEDKRGAQKSLIELMITMKEKYGVTPVLLTNKNNNLNSICDEIGIENYHFWYPDVMGSSSYSMQLINVIKHIVGLGTYICGSLWVRQIEKTGLDFDSIDLIHTNTNREDVGLYLSRKYCIPHMMHLREFGEEDFGTFHYRPRLIAAFNKNTEKFIAISKCVRDAWIKKGLDADKVEVIYNGLDTSRYKMAAPKDDGILKIVLAGAINKYKGQMQMIDAVYLLPDEIKEHVKVTFLGTGKFDYISQLKKKVDMLKLSNQIEFGGYSSNLEEKLREYDLGVITSRAEGFGRVTVEYMLTGLCVIASDTGANTEIIDNNVNGYIYRFGSASDLANKITYAYEHLEERQNVALAGYIKAREKYTTELNAKNIYDLYQTFNED